MTANPSKETGSGTGGRAARVGVLGLLVAVVAIVVPIVLGVRLAVGPGPLTQDPPSVEQVEEVALGTSPTTAEEPLPVEPRKVTALTIAPQRVHTLQSLFERHDYELASVASGAAAVPPIFVETIPEDWRGIERAETRKTLFVKTVLPLILKANAEIRTERRRLLEIAKRADGDPANLEQGERYWLEQLAQSYRLDGIDFAKLKQRVDVIPVSLALAQAANESGWGTSRFARQGNALFGQWTWNTSEGIKPKQQQAGKGNYAVRRFASLGDSVAAYMHNLNSHPAYAPMRRRRAQMRQADESPTGQALAGGLIKYSQRGQAYIKEIRGMISHNDFQRLLGAQLASKVMG